jgi:hypothetical protein
MSPTSLKSVSLLSSVSGTWFSSGSAKFYTNSLPEIWLGFKCTEIPTCLQGRMMWVPRCIYISRKNNEQSIYSQC